MDSVLTGRPFNLSKLSRTNLKRMVSFFRRRGCSVVSETENTKCEEETGRI